MTAEIKLNSSQAIPSIQQEKTESVWGDIEVIGKEEAFSSLRYFGIALVVAALAVSIFSVCFYAALSLFAVATWYLLSSVIILANDAAMGTSLEKPINRLHAMVMEVNSAIAKAASLPFTYYHGPWGDPNGRPILMLNGYLSFGSTWYYQRQKLVDAGFGPIYTMNVGSGESIATYAQHVQEKVQEIQKATGRKDLSLICHSKGGLVGSYYATHLADLTEEIDIVTIGSPLSGTPAAYFGVGQDAYEMRPESGLHKKIREKIKEHPQIRYFNIASEVDSIVPFESALLEGDRSRKLVLKDLGHVGMVFSSRVANQICAWLKSGTTT